VFHAQDQLAQPAIVGTKAQHALELKGDAAADGTAAVQVDERPHRAGTARADRVRVGRQGGSTGRTEARFIGRQGTAAGEAHARVQQVQQAAAELVQKIHHEDTKNTKDAQRQN
jgi:hypothetical protein